jgi:hypothetical protein
MFRNQRPQCARRRCFQQISVVFEMDVAAYVL